MLELSKDAVFVKNLDFPWQTMAGETIIIDPKQKNSFELNEVGSFIWNQIDGKRSLQMIRESVLGEYEVFAETLQEDFNELLSDLLESHLICEVPA